MKENDMQIKWDYLDNGQLCGCVRVGDTRHSRCASEKKTEAEQRKDIEEGLKAFLDKRYPDGYTVTYG